MHRLLVQSRRQPIPRGALAAEGEHVGRDVAAVDVQPGLQAREAAGGPCRSQVEGGLAVALDERPVEASSSRVVVELRPPASHQAVVPGLRATEVMPRRRCSSSGRSARTSA